MKLDQKIAVVTGAAQGLGKACALAFAQEGASVALADVNAELCRKSAEEIAQLTGRDTLAIATDISDPQQCLTLVERAIERFGRIDVLLSNAGILATGDILSVSLQDFDRVLAVNLRGSFVVGQAVARTMVAQSTRGAIINMSSINAVIATATQLSYAVSKGGVAQLTRAMALGLAEHGIRVNAIGPGTIDTEIIQPLMGDDSARNMILSRTPLRRLGEAAEVAKVAVFLASEDASYITGQTIYPDGGRLALNYTVPVG
jgi:NAD(P)-dependent dehydrogenase (short-subunit alcohol dehydrogenase family)